MLDRILEDSTKSSQLENSNRHFYLLLIIGKFLKSFTLIFTYDLLKSYHILWILFLTTFIAALVLVLTQTRFISISTTFLRNKTILCRLIQYSIYLTIIRFLWLYGLILCGPLRTILLYEHNDFVILACFHVLLSSSLNVYDHTSRIRGAILFISAIVAMFVLDTSQHTTARVCNRFLSIEHCLERFYLLIRFLIIGIIHSLVILSPIYFDNQCF